MDVPLMKTPKAVVAIYFCQKPVCLPLSELAEYVLPSFIPSNGIIMLIAAPSRICAAAPYTHFRSPLPPIAEPHRYRGGRTIILQQYGENVWRAEGRDWVRCA